MKMGFVIAGACLLFANTVAQAADDWSKPPKLTLAVGDDEGARGGELYQSGETTLDLFGGLTLTESTLTNLTGHKVVDDGRLGAGAGLNYFFSRYVGIGGEGYSENTAHSLVDHASGSLFIRFPLGDTGLAPYIFGGGGHIFDPIPDTSAHGGAGLEMRFTRNFGIFADARYVFTDKLGNYALGRAGLRLAF